MKDYAKLVNTPRETRNVEKAQSQEQPNLVRSAKELQPKDSQGNKNIFAILLVVFILVAVGYGVVRQYLATHHIDLSSGKITKEINQIKKSAAGATQGSVPQFDFYTVLPKGNTPTSAPSNNEESAATSAPSTASAPDNTPAPVISAPQPVAAPPSPPPKPAAPVTTINVSSNNAKYYLNVGDYSTNGDAQKMLSQLLLLGVQAAVMPKDSNGASVYEVLVGPFNDGDTMSVVRNQLNSHQINSVVIQ